VKVIHTNKKNKENINRESDKDGYNRPNMPKQAFPTGRLLTKAEIELLKSAELCKLLRLKKVPGRSKLTRKATRASALEGIATHGDLEGLSISLPQEVEVYPPQKAEKKRVKPGKGKRIDVPVGGMDVHKDTIYAAVATPAGIKDEHVFQNKEEGIDDLINYFKFHGVEHAALESTAEYWLKAFWKLTEGGINILVANPLQTKAAQGVKTDPEDARRIAIAFRDGRLKPSVLCTPEQYSMRKLNRDAIKKVQEGTKAVNRLNGMYEMFDAEKWIKKLHTSNRGQRILSRTLEMKNKKDILAVLVEEYSQGPKQIRNESKLLKRAADLTKFLTNMDISSNYRIRFGQLLEDHVRCERMAAQLRLKIIEFAANDARFKKNLELLLTLPNVGINTAITILVEIVDIRYFWRSKSLVKWSGLAPRVNQSGHRKRKTGSIYKGGNKWLRRAVWISAKNCYAHYNESDEPIGAFINRLYNHKHKHYFTAVTAGARKLVAYIYQVLTQQRPFQEVFELEHLEQLEKNRMRKLNVLQRMLNKRSVAEVLPIIANSLKEECYELERCERQIAIEIASKLGVAPRFYIDERSIRY
jgi:transposase